MGYYYSTINGKLRSAKSLKSEGWRLKELIKLAVWRGGPSSAPWKKLNPHTGVLDRKQYRSSARLRWIKNTKTVRRGKRRVTVYKQVMLSTKTAPLAKFAGAVRYKYDYDDKLMNIGFIRKVGLTYGMFKLAGMHAKGYQTPITPKMRKMLFALGFPVKKSTTTLETPARPLIEPVFREEKKDIMRNIEKKFMASILRYMKK